MTLDYNDNRVEIKTRIEDKDYIGDCNDNYSNSNNGSKNRDYIDNNNGKDDDKLKFIYFDDAYKDKSESKGNSKLRFIGVSGLLNIILMIIKMVLIV